jgi:hypothetical protein
MGSKHRKPAIEIAPSQVPGWPHPLGEAAMDGLLGDIIRTIEPHTEADPAALTLQCLAAFGNVVGRRPHFKVEADRHYPNLSVALVGQSARGRKGTSLGHVMEVFRLVDRSWAKNCIQPGLSTGEGLIQAIADNRVDHEAADKRFQVVEDEFSSVLRVMSRFGNTLSTTLRHAWDGRKLQVMTRESRLTASDVHISIIAQTTQPDLNRYLNQTDIFNGFANRFLWGCVQRSKLLPNGGSVPKQKLRRLTDKLKKSVAFAKRQSEVGLSLNATRIWKQAYPRLTADAPGLFGAATSRAEAQTRRLALIFALLDKSPKVRTKHLNAALEVWRFCEDSARFIFGERSTSSLEDKIRTILQRAETGLTRTQISQALQHHVASTEIASTLAALREKGFIRHKSIKTDGRPAEMWFAEPGKERHK